MGARPRKSGSAKVVYAVAAVLGAEEREQRSVLIDRKELSVAERPALRREVEADQNDHSQERFCHDSSPPTGRDGGRPSAANFGSAQVPAETGLIDSSPVVRRADWNDEQLEVSERAVVETSTCRAKGRCPPVRGRSGRTARRFL